MTSGEDGNRLCLSKSIQVLVQGRKEHGAVKWDPTLSKHHFPTQSPTTLASVSLPPPPPLPTNPGVDITVPFCFSHVATTRLPVAYLYESTLRNRTLGAHERFFLPLSGSHLLDPGRIPDFAHGISCLISKHSVSDSLMACEYKEGVTLQKTVYHLPLLTSSRGGTGGRAPNTDLQSWT